MENLDIQKIVYEYIKSNLIIDLSMENGRDYYDEYVTASVTVSLKNPDTGKFEEIGEVSDSVSLPSND